MSAPEILQAALAVAASALALFCFVLARRLRRLNDLETGLGGAIAVMTGEVARLEAAMAAAQREATEATQRLAAEVEKARAERALWSLQARFTPPAGDAAPRPQRLRRRAPAEAADA